VAVVYHGVSARALEQHYWPALRSIANDNRFGRIIYLVTTIIQHVVFIRRGVLRMVRREQSPLAPPARMSSILWDTFTGSAPYRDVFIRTLHPLFIGQFLADIVAGMFAPGEVPPRRKSHE
jgi:hypothetical protein